MAETQTIPPGGKAAIGYHPLNTADPPAPVLGASDVLLRILRVSDGYVYDWDDDTFKDSVWTTPQIALTESTIEPGFYRLNATGHAEGFDTSTIVNPVAGGEDTYIVRIYEGTGADIGNLPAAGEIITKTIAPDDILDDAFTASKFAADAIAAIQNGLATAASIAGLNDLSSAEAQAACDAALAAAGVDTTLTTRLTLAYRLLHNRLDVDEGNNQALLYDDAGASVILTIPLQDKNAGQLVLPVGIPYRRGTPT